jgi:hypothetical protein
VVAADNCADHHPDYSSEPSRHGGGRSRHVVIAHVATCLTAYESAHQRAGAETGKEAEPDASTGMSVLSSTHLER